MADARGIFLLVAAYKYTDTHIFDSFLLAQEKWKQRYLINTSSP
jgi:hypothetical protein